jgi:hypothetical protein
MLAIGWRLYGRSDRVIRGKWRILDEKVESGLMSDLELQGGSPACVDWGPIVWPWWTRLSCVQTHTRFMGSRKFSSLIVVELDDTLPRFTDDIGIVFEPPTDYPSRFSRGRRHEGEVGPGPTLWQSMRKVVLVIPVWFTCVMLSGYFLLQGDYWFESPRHPQIWVRLVRCCHSVEVLYHEVHMRLWLG